MITPGQFSVCQYFSRFQAFEWNGIHNARAHWFSNLSKFQLDTLKGVGHNVDVTLIYWRGSQDIFSFSSQSNKCCTYNGKKIRFRMNVIVLTYEDFVFSLNFSAKALWKLVSSSPVMLKTSWVKLPFSISQKRSLYWVFLFRSVSGLFSGVY